MAHLTLISFQACPFVQRAAILLQEQGREFETKYIDLANKPDWFLEISPSGKVPVLEVDGTPIFESAVILDFLDETAESGKLLPPDAVERAQHRMWISYISTIMSKGWLVQAAQQETEARRLVTELRGHFEELAKKIGNGPLWGGDTYTMVDASIAPIFQRLVWAEAMEPSLGLFEGLPKIERWRDALLARTSTKSSVVPDLETKSGKMLQSMGSWVARGVRADT